MSLSSRKPRKTPRAVRLARAWLWVALRKAERRSPDWLWKAAPWLSSLIVHLLVVFIMAVMLLSGRASDEATAFDSRFGQLRDDLTALAPDERTGEPFIKLDALEEPSISTERAPDDSRLSEMKDVPLKPQMRLETALSESVAEVGPVSLPELSVPFAGRRSDQRARLVRREGGTKESEEAVATGLDWIARHQASDGRWRLDTTAQCAHPGCPKSPAAESDTAATGLALLPLLGAGHTHAEYGPYQENVRRGLDWLVSIQKADGDLWVGGGNTHMYSHAIATMAISEAYGMTRDDHLHGPAQRTVNFIAEARNKLGGWRYNPGQAGDTSVFGWQMLALRSAYLAGLKVPRDAIQSGLHYLDRARADALGTTYSYQPGGEATPVMTAEALLIRQYLGWTRHNRAMVHGADAVARYLLDSKHKERNIYFWYYATQMLHQMRNDDWKRWNAHVRDLLVSIQVSGQGCDRGSWDPRHPQPDRWGASAGRLFTTSLSLLTLEVYYRYLPTYRDSAGSMTSRD